jgi:DNA-binding response OmpR family regulator
MTNDETLGRILVVDDNEMNRDMLSRRLQRQKYVVEMAENGERCLAMLQESPFDLIMLDIMMPKMNGYEVLETAKKDPNLQHIPFIMISAVDDLDSVVKCIELGAEDYLFKPFNPVLLKARVSATLEKYRNKSAALTADHPVLAAIRADAHALKSQIDNAEQQAMLDRILDNIARLTG